MYNLFYPDVITCVKWTPIQNEEMFKSPGILL